jgi:hypothetical protein
MNNMKFCILLIGVIILTAVLGACNIITGETLNIPVKVALGEDTLGMTEITILSVTKSTLKEPVDNPGITGKVSKDFKAGDPCIIIVADSKSNATETREAVIRIAGFDKQGVQKSWELAVGGPIMGGQAYRNIAPLSTTRVMVTASWAEDLAEIKLSVYIR